MPHQLRLCLALHNHQPVGNFDHVFEQAYQDSYLPFLDVLERFPNIRISLHTSGSLMEWLDDHHPEYVDRLAEFVAAGRIEIIGGAFYEPILTMIPRRDRVGQIQRYTQWLEHRLKAKITGLWTPERVWEQSLTSDLAEAGIRYTILDDFHFRCAGLDQSALYGHYVTENEGQTLSVFPGSEQLRYLIPFGEVHDVIGYLRGIAEQHPNAIVVFGDDGEKFGTWPDTKQHVYGHGWLERFFQQLLDNQEWLKVTTLDEALHCVPPTGKIYIPEGSYREMTEWAFPVPRQQELEGLSHAFMEDQRWEQLRGFIRGGYWRNFKVKYPETDEMYARMIQVSQRLEEASRNGQANTELLDAARQELYRGQCNCSYWHGAFGGVYLPHLRNAVFRHLIAADNLLDRATGQPAHWVSANSGDYNLDGRSEVRLANDRLNCLFTPSQGGQLYELDVKSICVNLGATLARRNEVYHDRVRGGAHHAEGSVASIHDRVVFKQEGLDQRLHYDLTAPKSLTDRFFAHEVDITELQRGTGACLSDFASVEYEALLRRAEDRVQVQLAAERPVDGCQIQITKSVTLCSGSSTLEIAYLLEGLPNDRTFHFGTDFHFASLPAGQDDRFFYASHADHRLGHLGSHVDQQDLEQFGLIDEWQGLHVQWQIDRPTHVWTYPVETVSQSEGGFELVHQSVAVIPHWYVRGDAEGKWSAVLRLTLDTQLAESRMSASEQTVTV